MVQCPVGWCDYENSPGSVAGHVSGKQDEDHDWEKLGFDGIWEFRNQFEAQSREPITILHMTDSHIGRASGGFAGKKWAVDCAEGFRLAVSMALELEVSAVVHTGDLFHNDTKQGITDSHQEIVGEQLARLSDAGIRFFYILGDHERDAGQRVMQEYEEAGWARNLHQIPVKLGDAVALYGQNFKSETFWKQENWMPEQCGDRYSLLALHQSITPFSGANWAQLDIDQLQQWTRINSQFQFDAIALGQFHREFKKESFNATVVCGGATARLGKTKRSIDPSVGLFTIGSTGVDYERFYL